MKMQGKEMAKPGKGKALLPVFSEANSSAARAHACRVRMRVRMRVMRAAQTVGVAAQNEWGKA